MRVFPEVVAKWMPKVREASMGLSSWVRLLYGMLRVRTRIARILSKARIWADVDRVRDRVKFYIEDQLLIEFV